MCIINLQYLTRNIYHEMIDQSNNDIYLQCDFN